MTKTGFFFSVIPNLIWNPVSKLALTVRLSQLTTYHKDIYVVLHVIHIILLVLHEMPFRATQNYLTILHSLSKPNKPDLLPLGILKSIRILSALRALRILFTDRSILFVNQRDMVHPFLHLAIPNIHQPFEILTCYKLIQVGN